MEDESKPDKRYKEPEQHWIADPRIGSHRNKFTRRVNGNTSASEQSDAPTPKGQTGGEQDYSDTPPECARNQCWQGKDSVGEQTSEDDEQQQAKGDSEDDGRQETSPPPRAGRHRTEQVD